MFVAQISDLQWANSEEKVHWLKLLTLQHVYNSLLGRLEFTLTVLTVKVKIWLHCPKNAKPHRPQVIEGFKTLYGIRLKFKVSIANLNKYKMQPEHYI